MELGRLSAYAVVSFGSTVSIPITLWRWLMNVKCDGLEVVEKWRDVLVEMSDYPSKYNIAPNNGPYYTLETSSAIRVLSVCVCVYVSK